MKEYCRRLPRHSLKQGGVALAIVLWFLAAMSLLVAGIVYQGRMDVRLAQAHVARAKASAAGDGAIHLMMARFLSAPGVAGSGSGTPPVRGRFLIGDLAVDVNMVPASGLVDVFSSPPELLAALFAFRAGLPAGEAKKLADNVVQLRSPLGTLGGLGAKGPVRLSTPEDLLRVPGFNRALLDAISDDIRAMRGGGDRLNWGAVPADVLQAIKGSSPRRVAALIERRSGSEPLLWNPRSEDLFRVDAVVQYGGQRWLRRRWVTMGPGMDSDLPWHSVRIEAPRAVPVGGPDNGNERGG